MGRLVKCKICGKQLKIENAYKGIFYNSNNNPLPPQYYCGEEHYLIGKKENEELLKRVKENKEKASARKIAEAAKKEEAAKRKEEKQRREVEERKVIEKRKADKDKVYYLICDIIGRKEIINTALWKEWEIWNRVATNEVIGQYLEEDKDYLISMIARLENNEYNRIRYLSAILKNKLGDYKPKVKTVERVKVQVDVNLYEPQISTTNKRRSLADLEDLF